MAGFDVTPSSPSLSISPFSSPEVMSPLRMLSYQRLWPAATTSRRGLVGRGVGMSVTSKKACLDGKDLLQPPGMPLLARVAGGGEGADDLPGDLLPDDPGAEAEDVHVVVLDPLMGGVGVVEEPGADAGELVGGHRHAHAAAADDDAALDVAAPQRAADRFREIGVVVGLRGIVSAKVAHVVARRREVGDENLLERVAGVIRGDGDLQPCCLLFPASAFASATICSTVKPNSLRSSLSGADAPKAARAMMRPSSPAYLVQPKVEAISTATRARHEGGSTES